MIDNWMFVNKSTCLNAVVWTILMSWVHTRRHSSTVSYCMRAISIIRTMCDRLRCITMFGRLHTRELTLLILEYLLKWPRSRVAEDREEKQAERSMHCWSYNNGHFFTIFLYEGRLCADVFVNDSCSFFRYFPRAVDYASTPANVDLSEEDSNVGHHSHAPANQRRFASRYYRSDRARRTRESQNRLHCHACQRS